MDLLQFYLHVLPTHSEAIHLAQALNKYMHMPPLDDIDGHNIAIFLVSIFFLQKHLSKVCDFANWFIWVSCMDL